MKVLLIYPPDLAIPGEEFFVTFPLGIGYLAAVLEKDGHEVVVLDAVIEGWEKPVKIENYYHIGLGWEEIRERIRKVSPDVVGISCLFTSQARQMHKIARIVKAVGNIPVIVGGAHPTALPETVMQDSNIDYVILGEGEESLSKLVLCIEKNRGLRGVEGLVYRRVKKIIVNQKKGFIENLDRLPYPARHLFPMDKYFRATRSHATFQKHPSYLTMLSSRGCPFSCTFCSIHQTWGYKWRGRSPESVVDEIQFLVSNYGVKEIHFEDDNLTLDRERMMAICDGIIKRKLGISWTTPNGVRMDSLDKKLLRKMKQSGCYALFLAIESGSDYVRNKLMNKKLSLKKIKEISMFAQKLGIARIAFFIFGMPGERPIHIKETIDLIVELDLDDILVSIASPYPGSQLYQLCLKENLFVDTDFSTLRPKYCKIKSKHITPREIEKFRNIAYLRFELMKFIRHPYKFIISSHQRTRIRKFVKFLLKVGV